jgi:hypothetical protein
MDRQRCLLVDNQAENETTDVEQGLSSAVSRPLRLRTRGDPCGAAVDRPCHLERFSASVLFQSKTLYRGCPFRSLLAFDRLSPVWESRATTTVAQMDANTWVPILISSFALMVSFLSLYFTAIRPARLEILPGEEVFLSHFSEGNFSISVPVSFINHGARTGVVRRLALLVQPPGEEDPYLLEPLNFQKVDDKGGFHVEAMVAPVAVGGRQSVTKQVIFRSSYERPKEFQVVSPGIYHFRLLTWTTQESGPTSRYPFSAEIPADMALALKQRLQVGDVKWDRVRLEPWRRWAARRLSAREASGL